MKDHFILLLLGIIQIKCWTTIPIRISKTNPVYPNTALNSLALICPKMESQCIGHQKRVLRASETKIMVGAVGKHSRRMEYLKIPENIPGIQVTFTYSVNNGWVKFQKQLSETKTIGCTKPTIYWHLICLKKVLLCLWTISIYQTKRFVRNHINDKHALHC